MITDTLSSSRDFFIIVAHLLPMYVPLSNVYVYVLSGVTKICISTFLFVGN